MLELKTAAKNAKLLTYISLGLFVAGIIYSIVSWMMLEQINKCNGTNKGTLNKN